jgi:hypothetical protein
MAKPVSAEKRWVQDAQTYPEKRWAQKSGRGGAGRTGPLQATGNLGDVMLRENARDSLDQVAPLYAPTPEQQVTPEDIRAAKYEFPAGKRAWLCKQLTDLRALLLAHNLRQALDLIDRIRARTVGASSSSVNRVMEVIARQARQSRWQEADYLAGDLIDAVFAFTSEGVRSWAAYRKKLDLRFFEHLRYVAPMTIALYIYDSLIVRLRSGGEDRYRLEMDRRCDTHARLAFTTTPRPRVVSTRLEWSVEGANTTGIVDDKALAIEQPGEGALPSWICGPGRRAMSCHIRWSFTKAGGAVCVKRRGETGAGVLPDGGEPTTGTGTGIATRIGRIKYR